MNIDNGNGNGFGGNRSQRQELEIDKTNLIVNYIPQMCTEEDINRIFMRVGHVKSVKIVKDPHTQHSYGFGFVKYTTPEEAAKAIETFNGMIYGHKRLKVSYSRPPGSYMKDSNLYVTNLPKYMSEEDVDDLFGKYGEIVQRTLLKDKMTMTSRGIAFVRFSTGEEAQLAMSHLKGKTLDKAVLPLYIRIAEDFGRRKAQTFCPPYMNKRASLPSSRRKIDMTNNRMPNYYSGLFGSLTDIDNEDNFLLHEFDPQDDDDD